MGLIYLPSTPWLISRKTEFVKCKIDMDAEREILDIRNAERPENV